MAEKYFVANGSAREGPFTIEELAGQTFIAADTLVWTRGMSDWARADQVAAVAALLPPPSTPEVLPPPIPSTPAVATPQLASIIATPPYYDDFILCNPRLPRIGRLICVYGILINPVWWLLSQITCLSSTDWKDRSDYAAMSNILSLLWLLPSGMALTCMMIGGFKLRGLKRSGIAFFDAGVWVDLVAFPLFCIAFIYFAYHLADSATPPASTAETVISVIQTVVSLAFLAFELAFVVWLRRHRHRLPPR